MAFVHALLGLLRMVLQKSTGTIVSCCFLNENPQLKKKTNSVQLMLSMFLCARVHIPIPDEVFHVQRSFLALRPFLLAVVFLLVCSIFIMNSWEADEPDFVALEERRKQRLCVCVCVNYVLVYVYVMNLC
jgi:hypothetical protein